MIKVDIFSGFLGAGKTTLIKKLIADAYKGEKLVLIENEFGDIGIDGGFMKDSGIEVNELNSGCICCSLVGDFHEALGEVAERYKPDRILIEPSGVGKLSDIIIAVQGVDGVEVNSATAIADATKCRLYMKNFGEFYNDQIEHAGAVILSRTGGMSEEKLEECVALIREKNPDATVVTTPWDELDGAAIKETVERKDTLERALKELAEEPHEHHHHEHDHHHEHEHDEHEEHEHGHHEHDHGHEHHHDHEHEHHHHDHEHHHHHHDGEHDADEIFDSWGLETPHKYSEADIRHILEELDSSEKYGQVLRAKGIVAANDGEWLHFDHVPGEADVRRGSSAVTGRLCVIGAELKEDALKELFML